MDVIYFSVNNWMSGEDYPPTETSRSGWEMISTRVSGMINGVKRTNCVSIMVQLI